MYMKQDSNVYFPKRIYGDPAINMLVRGNTKENNNSKNRHGKSRTPLTTATTQYKHWRNINECSAPLGSTIGPPLMVECDHIYPAHISPRPVGLSLLRQGAANEARLCASANGPWSRWLPQHTATPLVCNAMCFKHTKELPCLQRNETVIFTE
jgi:hypothetical protein